MKIMTAQDAPMLPQGPHKTVALREMNGECK